MPEQVVLGERRLGRVKVEERLLRDSDFSEEDKGVSNPAAPADAAAAAEPELAAV